MASSEVLLMHIPYGTTCRGGGAAVCPPPWHAFMLGRMLRRADSYRGWEAGGPLGLPLIWIRMQQYWLDLMGMPPTCLLACLSLSHTDCTFLQYVRLYMWTMYQAGSYSGFSYTHGKISLLIMILFNRCEICSYTFESTMYNDKDIEYDFYS